MVNLVLPYVVLIFNRSVSSLCISIIYIPDNTVYYVHREMLCISAMPSLITVCNHSHLIDEIYLLL